ncbi:MAG: NUDIX domain-containing protein [Halobacteriovoraceae bacterium]|jgi:8-oxo-dGTP pyrophosphatase MutT (NUDIX family)|nr:NUDIX domain-containing protein [Halobacteriovoraceae bacterium]
MDKRKVQSVIFYCAQGQGKHFLLLKMNKKRGYLWQNVTGGVDKNENFQDAAVREAAEETGLSTENIQQLIKTDIEFHFCDQWENNVTEKVFFIQVKNKWDVMLDPSEHCEFSWVNEKNISPKSVHYASNFEALQKAMVQNE